MATLALAVGLPLVVLAAAPTATIESGPTNGSTVETDTVTFTFTTTDADTTRCSIVGAAEADSYFTCGSPQSYDLPDGQYRFVVEVSNADGTASTSRTFTMNESGSGGGGGSDDDSEEDSPRSSSGGGTVRYQTPIYPNGPKVVMRPGTFAIVPSADNPYVAIAPATVTATPAPTARVASAQTTQPRTTASAPRAVVQAPRTTTTTAIPTSTVTTATSGTFGVATTVPAGAALGTLDGGVPNWLWAVLVAIVVLGVAGYAWSTTREV